MEEDLIISETVPTDPGGERVTGEPVSHTSPISRDRGRCTVLRTTEPSTPRKRVTLQTKKIYLRPRRLSFRLCRSCFQSLRLSSFVLRNTSVLTLTTKRSFKATI